MYTPHKYLDQALHSKVMALGYTTYGASTFPRVEIHSFDTTPTGAKGDREWEVTCLLDVISDSVSPAEADDIIEVLRGGINESLSVTGYTVVEVTWEMLNTSEEIDESTSFIQRRLQRVRFYLHKND